MIKRFARMFAALASRFRADTRGQIAIIFALSSTAIVVGMGSGVDLSRAYSTRQRLSQVAALTCQFSTRQSVVELANNTASGTGGFTAYLATVNAFATMSLASQNVIGATPTAATFFTAVQASTSSSSSGSTAPTNPVVALSASVPTYFMQMMHVPSITVRATINCLTASTTPQTVTSQGPGNSVNNVVYESFETPCGGYCYTAPDGSSTPPSSPSTATTATPGYVGSGGSKWYIIGYCVETDLTGQINATSPDGSHTAELDCGNAPAGSFSTAGNSSITTKAYLAPGHYELRYNYRSRVDYPNYDPVYICGSTASDVSWANDTNSGLGSNVLRTNQINVYLDLANTAAIPLHTTINGAEQLGGSNLIDMCVYSPTWIERSVKITVTTPAYYWLSFAADGADDSYGGQIDNIRLCQETCAGMLQDNFPPSWLAANNSGVNKVLFEDTFESPVYAQDPYVSTAHTKGGNLANSLGVTSISICNSSVKSPPGWPCQTAMGWATAPYNEVVYWEQGATQGSQYVSLQGWNPTTNSDISTYGYTNSGDPINRAISRPFLLDPGYYNVSYDYVSMVDFRYDFVYNNGYYPICTSTPTYPNSQTAYGQKHGYDYGSSTLYSQYLSTNFMTVYMSHGQQISTPAVNSTLGGAPTYTNPDGTTTSSPTVPPDGGSIFAVYGSVNPALDSCYYSQAYGWVPRSVNVKITKPGWYWLTFSAQGDPLTGTGTGPAIDDVKLTALGSLYMSGAPTTALTVIPVPAPQVDSTYSNSGAFNGFYIVADPKTPPAADQ